MSLDRKTAVMHTPSMRMSLGDITIKFTNPDPMMKSMLVTKRFIFCIGRYCKVVPGLKQMVMQVVSYSSPVVDPYCVFNSLDASKSVTNVDEVLFSQHGNCKQPLISSRPYIRTNPKVLSQIDTCLETYSSPSDVFHKVLGECGGPMLPCSLPLP